MNSHKFSHNSLSRSPFPAVYFAADDGANDAGGSNEPPRAVPVVPATPITPSNPAADIQRAVDSYLNSKRAGGDAMEALILATGDAHKQRQRAEAAEAKAGKIPDELQTELDEYRALGKVNELQAVKANEAALIADKTQRERTDGFRKAAQVAGYDADAVLEVIGEVPESEIVKAGEVETASLKIGDETKPFGDFMAERFSRIHDSLKAQPQKPNRVMPPVMGVNSGPVNSEAEARKAQESLYSGNNF